jgi:hypothetical protein
MKLLAENTVNTLRTEKKQMEDSRQDPGSRQQNQLHERGIWSKNDAKPESKPTNRYQGRIGKPSKSESELTHRRSSFF